MISTGQGNAQTRRDPQTEYRKLPAVDALLREPMVAHSVAQYGREPVLSALRTLLATARQQIGAGQPAPEPSQWIAALENQLAQALLPSLRSVINATGVIVHTNLGRAPLSEAALQAVEAVARGYSNLEYNLEQGERGSRHDHAGRLLCELTGAEDALVVNNNAAAVFLVLAGLCHGAEVLISRGQLVEIGGGFRIPDVLRQSGAHLVEVGATNRTHLRDFADAITPATAALMRVHSSNFRQIGFVSMPELVELAELVQRHQGHQTQAATAHKLILIDDLGSGTFLDTGVYGLAHEPMVQQSVAAGADIITFSGDKLLGGPQAGLIVGRKALIERLRRHPMARALRVDKMTLAALDVTLRTYLRGRAVAEIPVWQMISASSDELRARVAQWQAVLAAQGITSTGREGESAVGGGSLPGETLPTILLALPSQQPDADAARLRNGATPVICRIQQDLLLFDPRTVLPREEESLLTTIGVVMAHGE